MPAGTWLRKEWGWGERGLSVFLETPQSCSYSCHLFVTSSQPHALFQTQFVFSTVIR